ncbi:MAG: sugar ABC transporter ATP-binding protein [Alphaproteobacteria bacterium]
MPAPFLQMTGIAKRYPGVQALDGVEIALHAGEVLALLGENGAGKSTLLKILSGAETPDDGRILLDGQAIRLTGPLDAQESGIVTIYQEFNLIPTLSIAENVLLGREPLNALGLVDWRMMDRRARDIIAEVGLDLDPRRIVADLSVAEQQMVEIARSLSLDSRLIIMDEPTSALSDSEVMRLFDIIEGLKERGIAVIFVTHRLEEVMQICDAATVLRDGQLVGSAPIAELTVERIIQMMVGRDVERLFARRPAHGTGEVALEIEGLESRVDSRDPHNTHLSGIDLSVHRGEILGLAGLVGAGRTELARAIFGVDPISAGRIRIEGREISPTSPEDAIKAGIGLVPEDRKQQALFLSLAVKTNLSIAALDRLASKLGWIDRPAEDALVERYRERLAIRMASPDQEVGNLSGGNQQKVVLARWLALEPKVLIVDEPTRGIDVAAKAEVHQLLFELAQSGIAIIVISSELPEVMTVSDRIVTLREGRITGEVMAAEASEEQLLALMSLKQQAA